MRSDVAPADARQRQRKREKRDVHGWCILDKPVGMTSTHAVERGEAAVPGEARRPCRHARSAGVRAAADRARRGDQDRAVRDGRPQDLSLHGALGRGARHRRQRGPRHRQPATSGRRRSRSARCCRASPAPSSRCRRASPRSRSTASAPTISRARARSWNSRPRPVDIHRLELVETPDADHSRARRRMRQGHLCARARPRHGPRARLLRPRVGAAADRRRPFQEADAVELADLQAAAPAEGGDRHRALIALLQPVAAGLRSLPSLGVSRADAARLARGQAGAAARPRRPDHAGLSSRSRPMAT